MIVESVKEHELEYLKNMNTETRINQVEAINLDVDTLNSALKECREDVYNALGVLMFAVNAGETETVKNALAEIRLKKEALTVLQEYRNGLIQAIDESRFSIN